MNGTLEPETVAAHTGRPLTRQRPTPSPAGPQRWRTAGVFALWALLLGVTSLWVGNGGLRGIGSLAGGLDSIGRITGLIASALLLVQVLLMARVPWLERAWGQSELARAHRIVGFTSFTLLWAHIALITLGYAADAGGGTWRGLVGHLLATVWDFTTNYPGMLLAIAGTLALCLVVATSIRLARRRLRYESWHLLHLYGYLGAGLALPHQLWTGADFTASRPATVLWWSLYAICAGAVLVFRVAIPIYGAAADGLRVVQVRREGASTVSVTVAGPGVARLAPMAGQFFHWRFLDGPGWMRANPFSLSAAPDGRTLRLTAAEVGDGTARLAALKVGTRVIVEGPYGRMHEGVRNRRKVLLMGSGIGIAPLRALLEGLDAGPGEMVVIHRVRSAAEAVLADEIDALAQRRGARYVLVPGPRANRPSWLPASAGDLRDEDALLELVPDLAERDVYLCGSPIWMDAARIALLGAGVEPANLHSEQFAY